MTLRLGRSRRSALLHLVEADQRAAQAHAKCGALVTLNTQPYSEGMPGLCQRCLRVVNPEGDTGEPALGSIVLAEGPTGTAWQRLFSDGLWHSTTGRTATYQELLEAERRWKRDGLLLVHDTGVLE